MTWVEFETFYQVCTESAENFIRSKKYDIADGIILALCKLALYLEVEPPLSDETLHELAWMFSWSGTFRKGGDGKCLPVWAGF